ncbi:MAG: YbaK/EbsC family protein [Pseudomonadota bacterium]
MSKSEKRVTKAAKKLGLRISIQTMPETTRSAADAAKACCCEIDQIVKSLIFEGENSNALKLVLVGGHHDLDLTKSKKIFGERLERADPNRVRSETGFAIGGVAPIGHLETLETWIDGDLLKHGIVWAAAGTPKSVFSVSPGHLARVTNAQVFTNS